MMIETHGMNPMKVLAMVKSMGGGFKRIVLVGCEPATFGPEVGHMGLSDVVDGAVDEAANVVESLVAGILNSRNAQAMP
jgi:hydrogenase maturation protease